MNEFEQERHQMTFTSGEDGDADELYCPTCGRKILVTWGPEFRKTVIVPGDENALHSAGSGGLTFGAVDLTQEDILDEEDKIRLEDWEGWLQDMNFSDRWGQESS